MIVINFRDIIGFIVFITVEEDVFKYKKWRIIIYFGVIRVYKVIG